MRIKDVMSKEVITIGEEENLVQLIAKFRKYNYHTLPVIDESKKILGVISSEDIMKVCLPHNPVLGNLLKSTQFYSDLTIDDVKNIIVFSEVEPKSVSDMKFGEFLFEPTLDEAP